MNAKKKPVVHSTVHRDRPADAPPTPLPAKATRGPTRATPNPNKPVGRPRGPAKKPYPPTSPHAGSLFAKLAGVDVGGYLYLEAPTADEITQLQSRVLVPKSRLADSMKDMVFATSRYTAVNGPDVRHLLRIERIN